MYGRGCLTNAVRLHVALARHAVPPQALVSVTARQTVLHPIVCCRGDHQKNVPNKGAEEASAHETIHPDLRLWGCSRAPEHRVGGMKGLAIVKYMFVRLHIVHSHRHTQTQMYTTSHL